MYPMFLDCVCLRQFLCVWRGFSAWVLVWYCVRSRRYWSSRIFLGLGVSSLCHVGCLVGFSIGLGIVV